MDSVIYDDKFPWPIVADGLGIDNDMLEFTGDPPPADFADWRGMSYADFTFKGFALHLYVDDNDNDNDNDDDDDDDDDDDKVVVVMS